MSNDGGIVFIAVAVVVALLGSGIGAAFLIGRRSRTTAAAEVDVAGNVHVERMANELDSCLELGDYVIRDADTLAAVLARQPGPQPVVGPNQHPITAAKHLAGHLEKSASEDPSTDKSAASLPQEKPNQKSPAAKRRRLPASPFEDARNFPRSIFRGTASAMIYPRHPAPGREPLQCTVLTRDLSCGGIGIAYSDQLFPKQIVVLEVVGKLLVGEVRWCRRVDENFYLAGCQLMKTNS